MKKNSNTDAQGKAQWHRCKKQWYICTKTHSNTHTQGKHSITDAKNTVMQMPKDKVIQMPKEKQSNTDANIVIQMPKGKYRCQWKTVIHMPKIVLQMPKDNYSSPTVQHANSVPFYLKHAAQRLRIMKFAKKCLHFSICACHPCVGAMLIFSVSFQF